MKKLLIMLLLSLAPGLYAQSSSQEIHSIVRGSAGEPHLIKLTSGEVRFIESDQKAELEVLEHELAAKGSIMKGLPNALAETTVDYTPTIVSTTQVTEIFNRLNPFMRRKSECSDRAQVWAWDEFQRSGIKSEKVFLLLTDSYIRRNRYKWWFHVAPLFTTEAGEKIVMDFQFLDRPVTFETWKNHLVFSQRECVREFRFLDYDAGADQSQDCYAKFTPMYYHIPADIRAEELGSPKLNWNPAQVNAARSRAFFKGGR